MISRADIAAVESRIAQLSSAEYTPAAPADRGDASFTALLAASGPVSPGESTRPAPAPCIIPQPLIERIIAAACGANGADPALVKAVIATESSFDASATSSVGAQGLMQLMPATAADLGVHDAYDPQQNIAGGTKYLSGLLKRFSGNVPLAVAAYNAGPGAVERGDIGAETHRYVRSVLASLSSYERSGRAPKSAGHQSNK